MADDNRLEVIEFAEKIGRMINETVILQVIDRQIKRIELVILDLPPTDRDGFSNLISQKQGLLDLLIDMRNAVAEGEQLRREMSPDYEPPKPLLV